MDCFNHSNMRPGAHQSWDLEGDKMVLKALRDHDAGEEIFITYGDHSNPLLLRTYGFAVPPADEASWTVSIAAGDLQNYCTGNVAKEFSEAFFPSSEFQLRS